MALRFEFVMLRQAFGETDRLVAIVFLQVTLIREEICYQHTLYLSYTRQFQLKLASIPSASVRQLLPATA